MTLALLLFLSCQDNEYVQKLDKVKYNLATRSCREAEKRLDSDEATAIDRLTRIIDDPDLPKKECILFIQQTDQYDPPYAFLPYQYRARARISLASRTKVATEKKTLLEDAVRDLEESLRRNVKSSGAYLETAKAELRRVADDTAAPPPAEPAAPLGPRVAQLIAGNRFKSAQLLVDREGGSLSAKDRTDLAAQVEHACRSYLTEELRRFRGRLQLLSSVAQLRSLTKDEFELTFELPPAGEIPIAHPATDWARRGTGVFLEVWSGRKPGSALLTVAEEASHLEEGAENPWLKICGSLAFQDLQAEVDRRIAECTDAPKARRDALAAEIQSSLDAWKAFVDHLDPAVRQRASWIDDHTKSLRASAERQPRDLAELDGEDLRGCFERFPVEPELLAFEARLRKVEASGGLALESRRKLYSLLVAARSFRLLLEGKTEAEASKEARADLENLSRSGGAVDPDRFGPRIRKVYDSLR